MAEIAKIKGYDIRDKKLADATSQSTVAATDAIEMKTTSGDQVYITRDSFVQAMASVLNSNSQSTISQLFGADANGNHAAINMSNLAKVIGHNSPYYVQLAPNIWAFELSEVNNYNISITIPSTDTFVKMTGISKAAGSFYSYEIMLHDEAVPKITQTPLANGTYKPIRDVWTGVVDGKRVYKINASHDVWHTYGGGLLFTSFSYHNENPELVFNEYDKNTTGLTKIFDIDDQ